MNEFPSIVGIFHQEKQTRNASVQRFNAQDMFKADRTKGAKLRGKYVEVVTHFEALGSLPVLSFEYHHCWRHWFLEQPTND